VLFVSHEFGSVVHTPFPQSTGLSDGQVPLVGAHDDASTAQVPSPQSTGASIGQPVPPQRLKSEAQVLSGHKKGVELGQPLVDPPAMQPFKSAAQTWAPLMSPQSNGRLAGQPFPQSLGFCAQDPSF
jgi:hypothetical protein